MFSVFENDVVLQDSTLTAANGLLQTQMHQPTNLSQADLAFGFSIEPTSGLLYKQAVDNVVIMIKEHQSVLFGQSSTLDNATRVIGTANGTIIEPIVLENGSSYPDDGSNNLPPTIGLSGLAGYNSLGSVLPQTASGVKYTENTNYNPSLYPWMSSGNPVYWTAYTQSNWDAHYVQYTSNTAKVVLGASTPQGYVFPAGSEGGDVFETPGHLLLTAGSNIANYGGTPDSPHDAGGSVYILSGEGGVRTGSIIISSHEAQNPNSPTFVFAADGVESGDVTLQSGNVLDMEIYPVTGPGNPWTSTPKSGNVYIKSGSGTRSGKIEIKTGDSTVYVPISGGFGQRYADVGALVLQAGNLYNYGQYTGPSVAAGTVAIKAGDIISSNGYTPDGISPGEVVITPGTVSSSEAGKFKALVRIEGSAGLQIPYGAGFMRPSTGGSQTYWNMIQSGQVFDPYDAEPHSPVGQDRTKQGVGTIRACDDTGLLSEIGVSELWLEMYNGVDWQRFYSQDYLMHRHAQNTSANQWVINHDKNGEFGFPTVQIWTQYISGNAPAGTTGAGWKTIDPSQYECFIPDNNHNQLVIVFAGAAQYSGMAILHFTPNAVFNSGFYGSGDGEGGRGGTSA